MKRLEIRSTLVLSAVLAALAAPDALAQTTTAGTSTGTAISAGGTATATTTSGTTTPAAPAPSSGESRYLARITSRYSTLAGSPSNLERLVHGLRTGTAVTLTTASTTTAGAGGTSTAMFTPPTRPMGYGNITRALTFANRELAHAGITDPTPQQLQAALMGGTVTTAQGTTQMQGVLQLRSQGLGWGEIAHTIAVAPGNATASAVSSTRTPSTGITTAAGTRAHAGEGKTGARRTRGITTPAGSATTATRGHDERAEHYASRGIVTAAGTPAVTAQAGDGRGNLASSAGIVSASGAAAGNGIVNGAGRGNSGEHARSKH